MNSGDILNKIIDSNNFTVGGGSASALSGAMAAGMASMVAKLSIGKEYGMSDEDYNNISSKLDKLASDLTSGAEEDSNAYCMIRSAYKLPKFNELEVEIRKKEIQRAGIQAARVPLSNALKCREVYDLSINLKNNSNPNASSDLDIAIHLSKLAILGCILNIESNLPLIKNEKIEALFNEEIVSLRL